MALSDELYSDLVSIYQSLDNEQIHKLNARLILLLSQEVSDQKKLRRILEDIDKYKQTILN